MFLLFLDTFQRQMTLVKTEHIWNEIGSVGSRVYTEGKIDIFLHSHQNCCWQKKID